MAPPDVIVIVLFVEALAIPKSVTLAILSLEKLDLTYAALFENSDELKLGSSVACIGNPLGILPGSVSSGVVSYINRNVQTDDYTTQTLIQTDVAINSGNSGGPLIDEHGNVQAVVFAGVPLYQGLNFAIPVEYLRQDLPFL